ncbi:TPA: TRAP transporter large permease [Escherichia coli]|uniref:TRAP transporter large permease n=1 Tax=Escherichia coli TaxID=562 RepID=UPI000DDFEF4D|nr:TRAP transporter large permease [Escherichia coli]EEW7591015.1 TRAP transporter large permease [Escherichia coli]EFO3891824.1 TRAP transporter large permease [Escherichia coli]EHC1749556.1 TRAP transporter large permease [Escherichia coli]EHH7738454.1 TRAP transporter large permease [Escherichia coli]EHX2562664.1 TRAP transporter large permease [Escherichia coli]
MDAAVFSAAVLFGTFFIMLFLGFPVAFGIGLASILALWCFADWELALNAAAQGLATGVDGFTFLAIPLFVIAGGIMNRGSIALRLINLTKVIAAPLPGALAHANIIANTLFGALAGIASAAAMAVGGTIQPHAKKEGYHSSFMAAVNAASAPSGLVIPPSASLILFSLYSGGTSIAALFLAGYLPGILWCLSVMIPALYFTYKHKYTRGTLPSFKDILHAAWQAIPSLLLIIVIISGIVGGIFTATEAAGMAVLFSFLLSCLYREITLKDMLQVFIDSIVPTVICIFLVATSGIMGWALSYISIPTMISDFILSVSNNKIVLLILINLMLLLIGTFLDLTPALIIFTPILMPVFRMLGLDPVHVGIMLVFNLSIGLITPPVGTLLFVACSIENIPFQKIIRPILPIIGMLIFSLMLITFVPDISLAVPRMFGLVP